MIKDQDILEDYFQDEHEFDDDDSEDEKDKWVRFITPTVCVFMTFSYYFIFNAY